MKEDKYSSVWPKVSNYEESLAALRFGTYGMGTMAIVTFIVLVINLVIGSNYKGIAPESLFDIFIAASLAYFIYYGSTKAAFLACFYFVLNLFDGISSGGGFGLLGIFVFFMMLNSFRGAIKFNKFAKETEQPVQPPTAKWINITMKVLGYLLIPTLVFGYMVELGIIAL